MDVQTERVVSELRQDLSELYGKRLKGLVVYGSRARGDAVDGSDIDVLVVLRGPVSAGQEVARTGGIAAEISFRYDVVVSCTFVDSTRFESGEGPLIRNIRREGVPV